METLDVKLKRTKNEKFGFTVAIKDGRNTLEVTSVIDKSLAFKENIKLGDIIIKINGKSIKQSKKDWCDEINSSKPTTLALQIQRPTELFNSSSQSYNNLSTSDVVSQKLSTSNSEVNIARILEENYIQESDVNNFMEPPDKNVDSNNWKGSVETKEKDSEFEEEVKVNLTIKTAYRTSVQTQSRPKIQLKYATKNQQANYETKPTFILKKKVNIKNAYDCNGTELNMHKCMSMSPIDVKSITSIPEHQSSIESTPATITSSFSEMQLYSNRIISGVEIKIFNFYEQIKKGCWKKFTVEKESIGVSFTCEDKNYSEMPNSSIALDPRVVGIHTFVELWKNSNSPSRFLLPIGQKGYEKAVLTSATFRNIRMHFERYNVLFVINLLNLNKSDVNQLFEILNVLPPQASNSKRKQSSNMDEGKVDLKKQQQYLDKLSKPFNNESELHKLPLSTKYKNVPLLVVVCAAIIEKCGIREEGIYRKNGNLAARNRLEDKVYKDDPSLWSSYTEWNNVHTVANLMKRIFKNFTLLSQEVSIRLALIELDNLEKEDKLQAYMDMQYHLSVLFRSISCAERRNCRQATFCFLLKHLNFVSKFDKYTLMSASNIATCVMPNLIEGFPTTDEPNDTMKCDRLAEKNMIKMVEFWIKNADFVIDILLDDNVLVKVQRFIDSKSKIEESDFDLENVEHKTMDDIQGIIEEVTLDVDKNDVCTRSRSFTSPGGPLSPNSRLGQSLDYAKSKKVNLVRRSSSISPKTSRKAGSGPSKTTFTQNSLDSKNMLSTFQILSMSIKNLPLAVEICVKLVENFGLNVEGIYRKNAQNSDVAKLKEMIYTVDPSKWLEVHYIDLWRKLLVTSCLLKSLLKDMAIISKDIWIHMSNEFSANHNSLRTLSESELKRTLLAAAYYLKNSESKSNPSSVAYKGDQHSSQFNLIRYTTLKYVLSHLSRVSAHSSATRMNRESLSVCFMPTLMEEDSNIANIQNNTRKNTLIMNLLIRHVDWIFHWTEQPDTDRFGTPMTKSLYDYLIEISPSNETEDCSYSTDAFERNEFDTDAPFEDVLKFISKILSESFSQAVAPSNIRRKSDSFTIDCPLSDL